MVIAANGQAICDMRDFLLLVEKELGITSGDFADLMTDYVSGPEDACPEVKDIYDVFISIGKRDAIDSCDGIFGDDYYTAIESLDNIREDLRREIGNLKSPSRKNNTKADIARRLEAIESNLEYVL